MKSIYDKYCDGDTLSDEEILKGMDEFKNAEEALLKLGPCFQIAQKNVAVCTIL